MSDALDQLASIVAEQAERDMRTARAALLRDCGGDLSEYRRRVEAMGVDWQAFVNEGDS